ncbi:MAG: transcription antitermination factor NusB [Candidatus Dojkabacteria bacterium]|nr:transcription antitermination factor NusB [Candidatus Dojkabacteria bacterium]
MIDKHQNQNTNNLLVNTTNSIFIEDNELLSTIDFNDKRRLARLFALIYLYNYFFLIKYKYQLNQNPSRIKIFELNSVKQILQVKKINKKIYVKVIEAVMNHFEECDKIISLFATARPIEEINLIDLCILRMALAEGFIEKLTPQKVVINEAIELAKMFSGHKNASFVNAILSQAIKNNI